jgi:prepilin-type N-terminal cleavage/methylation domain-containing protein
MRQLKTGFTIIELIVVITLLGLLAAIAGPSFSQFIETSRLQYSQQLVETNIGKAFSFARSHPETKTIHGWAGSRSFSVLPANIPPQNTPCATESETCHQLDRGVGFEEDFSITFTPPYGDIEPREGETVIRLKSKNYAVQMIVYHASGLVETLIPETE